jgi:hypothetical protein
VKAVHPAAVVAGAAGQRLSLLGWGLRPAWQPRHSASSNAGGGVARTPESAVHCAFGTAQHVAPTAALFLGSSRSAAVDCMFVVGRDKTSSVLLTKCLCVMCRELTACYFK